MGTESYVLVGMPEGEQLAFSSACHDAGRSMSRTLPTKHWCGRMLIDELREQRVPKGARVPLQACTDNLAVVQPICDFLHTST